MEVALELDSTGLDVDALDQFTRELTEALSDVSGADAELASRPHQAGERGGPVIIGKILLDVFKSSAAGSLIEVLGAHFNRERSISGKITTQDGVIEFNAKNLGTEEFQQALAAMMAKSAKG